MRTLLRTTLVTMLVVFSVLAIWSLMHNADSVQSVQAAPGTDIPASCAAELAETMAKPKSPYRQGAVQTELACAADARTYPARKMTALAKFTPPVFPPTETPGPTATLQVGIQQGNYVSYSRDIFIPTENINNLWADFVNGNAVQVFAGSQAEQDENWRQDHPEWVAQGAQGVLYVVVNYDWLKHNLYPTPSRHGAVHFIAACGTKLVLQAADGTTFVFDAATLSYVDNAPVCPTVTP